ncbi:barstar family protein [Qipengyuania aquimaris]|uniref:barstar family protein n=1 Tax=Qipengyuania aquimaris TaxID=255984 RepID=UPI001FD42715|nr:barstar family protein [Qipengyuania aquimaris]UOR14396.1 barstar family protein [Qipengyuania aquimaris]
MREIPLDASGWRSRADLFEALADALGSVEWHGRNADAFLETMIYHIDLNAVQPPYEIMVRNAPSELKEYVIEFASWVREAREDRKGDPEWGDDIEVSMVVV